MGILLVLAYLCLLAWLSVSAYALIALSGSYVALSKVERPASSLKPAARLSP